MANKIAQTTLYYKDGRVFFVSTIDRECSSMIGAGSIYAETMAWELDIETMTRKVSILYQGSCARGSIVEHQRVVEMFHKFGRDTGEEE